jgi:hypothetical protein
MNVATTVNKGFGGLAASFLASIGCSLPKCRQSSMSFQLIEEWKNNQAE